MSNLREEFRPILKVRDIHQVADRDLAYNYKYVTIETTHEKHRVEKYLARGWEVVETTEVSKDDRSFTPNSKEKKLRPQLDIITTSCGKDQVLMRILKSLDEENHIKDKQARDKLHLQQSKGRGDSTVSRGNEIITTGSEINV